MNHGGIVRPKKKLARREIFTKYPHQLQRCRLNPAFATIPGQHADP
jgi:hypothetical protein